MLPTIYKLQPLASDMINPSVTGDSSELSIEESRRLIDQRKDELYELIRQLNSGRNELAPISVLPPELLGRIFTFVVDKTADIQYFTSRFSSSLGFTYVSQNWRNVALDTPGLWDTPALVYPTWARAMLERSKMADLVVDSNFSLNADQTIIKEIFDNHIDRVREIDLRGLDPPVLSSILENVQPSSLPLHSLRLTTSQYWTDDESSEEFPVFPAHLVQPDSLRRLVIVNCAFDSYAQPLPQLTHLLMERPRDRPLLSEFATALSGMPALESLKMIQSLPLATHAVKLDVKVELPKLSILSLSSTENFFEVLNVVDFLIVPWTARIDLSETTPRANDTVIQLSHIVSPLSHFFSCMSGNERKFYNRLRLYDPGHGLGLWAWRTERQQSNSISDLPDLDLSLNFGHYRSDSSLNEILRCLPPFDLQTLLIDINFGRDTIHSFFGQSTTLQTLELQSNVDIYDFLQVLTHKPEGYERLESSYYSVSFPALQSLKFVQSTFGVLGTILDCLMERYERGAGLQTLVFCMCFDLDHEHIRLLREIVPDVEWDEYIITEEYEHDDYGYGDYGDSSSDSITYDHDYL